MSKANETILDHVKLRRLRERAKMTQEEAAVRSGMKSRQQWNEIEAGRQPSITLTTLAKIAAAVGCGPRDLIVPPGGIKPPKRRRAVVAA